MTLSSTARDRADDLIVASSRSDLSSRSAIHDLVVGFYREIVFDEVLNPVFSEAVEVDWSVHIPKLIDYWCRVLLGEPGYAGSVLGAHRHVHDLTSLDTDHFDRWYSLWVRAIDDNWTGPIADRAKEHAARIGGTLARHVLDAVWRPRIDAAAIITEGKTA